jgi:hypothetical protein
VGFAFGFGLVRDFVITLRWRRRPFYANLRHMSEVAQKDVAVIKEIAALLETEAQAEADPRRSFLKTRAARLATRQVHPSNRTPRPAAVISAMGQERPLALQKQTPESHFAYH